MGIQVSQIKQHKIKNSIYFMDIKYVRNS